MDDRMEEAPVNDEELAAQEYRKHDQRWVINSASKKVHAMFARYQSLAIIMRETFSRVNNLAEWEPERQEFQDSNSVMEQGFYGLKLDMNYLCSSVDPVSELETLNREQSVHLERIRGLQSRSVPCEWTQKLDDETLHEHVARLESTRLDLYKMVGDLLHQKDVVVRRDEQQRLSSDARILELAHTIQGQDRMISRMKSLYEACKKKQGELYHLLQVERTRGHGRYANNMALSRHMKKLNSNLAAQHAMALAKIRGAGALVSDEEELSWQMKAINMERELYIERCKSEQLRSELVDLEKTNKKLMKSTPSSSGGEGGCHLAAAAAAFCLSQGKCGKALGAKR